MSEPNKKILVTGGAGYVGSHCVAALLERDFQVVVFDDLSQGHAQAVAPGGDLIQGSLLDREAVGALMREGGFHAVLHFAARSLVGESMSDPWLYFRENMTGAVNLVEAAAKAGVRKVVVSSTANLFGAPERQPIAEDAAIDPGSPYGESKYMMERMLVWADRCAGVKSACLRYFNAAGAHPDGRIGEDHTPETHLIPLVLDAAAGKRSHIEIYGEDYPTPDGTCVRDYVHVSDLADAHIRVLDLLETRSVRYNLGNGRGYSVREVIAAAERVTGRSIPVRVGPRRAGDPAVLVASSATIQRELGWTPRFPDLDDIIATAWAWRQAHPGGYGGKLTAAAE